MFVVISYPSLIVEAVFKAGITAAGIRRLDFGR